MAINAQQVLSATRVHFPKDSSSIPEVTVKNLQKYAVSIQQLGIGGAIAVNGLEDLVFEVISEAAPGTDIQVLHVPVWGAFVPALNTLLGEAQRRRIRYILYQSLEVICPAAVLEKMLDHHTADTLVVGPVLNGHIFNAGEQKLNGRTTPWNTLALWSTQKLGLTGFLSVADGMPDLPRRMSRQLDVSSLQAFQAQLQEPPSPTMGSQDWWESCGAPRAALPGPLPTKGAIPAGVEEVTAVALLQHLLGESRARAVLLQLPPALESSVSWKTSWDGDERRRQWHEYKMNTKITRPAAQIQQLFGSPRSPRKKLSKALKSLTPKGSRDNLASFGEEVPPEQPEEPSLTFGTVHHYGESIPPPRQVERICLASVALFSANSASALATALHAINADASDQGPSLIPMAAFAGLLVGGVYIPMPLSLCLSRWAASAGDHIAALAVFAGIMIIAHTSVFLIESSVQPGLLQQCLLLAARVCEGFGAGVLFQTRFVLASTSTSDHHLDLQTKTFLAGDLGLGVGALLPCFASLVIGRQVEERVAGLTSAVLAMAASCLLIWILLAFPRRLHRFHDRVRFPVTRALCAKSAPSLSTDNDSRYPALLLASGTARVFVQSSAMIALALWMRDVGLTGNFRQTKGVAALCLLPVPLEAVASSMFCPARFRLLEGRHRGAAMAMIVAAVAVFFGCASTRGLSSQDGALFAGVELTLLLKALALAAPHNVSNLHRHRNAEQSLVTLEWLKAYVGRLLGPIFALAIQTHFGYGPLFALLTSATVLVALTA